MSIIEYFHGTRADLKPGELIEAGRNSNFGKRKKAAWVYLTATLDAATWGAELAAGEGPGGSTSSSRPGRSKTTPTSPTRSSPATRRSPTARASRCA